MTEPKPIYEGDVLAKVKKAQKLKEEGDRLSGQTGEGMFPERSPITGVVPGIPEAGVYNPKTGKVEGAVWQEKEKESPKSE